MIKKLIDVMLSRRRSLIERKNGFIPDTRL